jgi:hypothetical protein
MKIIEIISITVIVILILYISKILYKGEYNLAYSYIEPPENAESMYMALFDSYGDIIKAPYVDNVLEPLDGVLTEIYKKLKDHTDLSNSMYFAGVIVQYIEKDLSASMVSSTLEMYDDAKSEQQTMYNNVTNDRGDKRRVFYGNGSAVEVSLSIQGKTLVAEDGWNTAQDPVMCDAGCIPARFKVGLAP